MIDLLLLRLLGCVVVFHFRGTEARLATSFARDNPFHFLGDDPYNFSAKFPEAVQRLIIDFVRGMADAVLVTDPELQSYVPGARIVPRAIDLEEWEPLGVSTTGTPRIVHAPSRHQIKGTEFVLAAVDRLRAEGLDFEFELIQNLSHAEAKRRYESADIIIDQLRIGWYGVLGVEGMALGKPVVAYVREDLQHHLGDSPPLGIARPDNVADVLRELILDQRKREELGAAGRRYVEEVHDARVIAGSLESLYQGLLADRDKRGADYELIAGYLRFQAELAEAAESAGYTARVQIEKGVRELSQLARRESLHVPATPDPARLLRRGIASVSTRMGRARQALDAGRLDSVAPAPAAAGSPRPHATRHVQLSDVIEPDTFGLGELLRPLLKGEDASWEALGRPWDAADHTVASEVLAQAAQAWRNADEAGQQVLSDFSTRFVGHVARHLRIGPAGWTLARSRQGVDEHSLDASAQIQLARAIYNLRTVIPTARAIQLVDGLMRPLVTSWEHGGLLESHHGLATVRRCRDRTNEWLVADLLRTAVNGYAPSRVLKDPKLRNAWDEMVRALADLAQDADVEAFGTTRSSLVTMLPIRLGFDASSARVGRDYVGPATLPGPVTFSAGGWVGIHQSRAWFEGSLRFHVSEARTPIRLDLTRALDDPAFALPVLRYDPFSAVPRVVGWDAPQRARSMPGSHAITLDVPHSVAVQGSGLTHFRRTGGGSSNAVHAAHVRSMETLNRLYPGHGFGEMAARWRSYMDQWPRLLDNATNPGPRG
jgi:hypothetical protein